MHQVVLIRDLQVPNIRQIQKRVIPILTRGHFRLVPADQKSVDDLIPLSSQGPNVFYGFCDSLWDLLEYGEDPGPYWLKSMVMDRYKASRAANEDSDDAEPLIGSAGITSDSEKSRNSRGETSLDVLQGSFWRMVRGDGET